MADARRAARARSSRLGESSIPGECRRAAGAPKGRSVPASSRCAPASAISPEIQGRPDIQNVSFDDPNPNDDDIGLSFDITSHVTVKGRPTDKSVVRLLRYVLESEAR